MVTTAERFSGSLLAVVLADAMGAPYEGGILEKVAWKAISLRRPGTLLYTDDGDMTIGCLDSLTRCGEFNVADMAMTWAKRANAGRGYGGGAIRCLKLIRNGVPWTEANRRIYPKGSYGNGAAMRVAPLALWSFQNLEQLEATVRLASSVTHAHPLGVDGALLIGRAIAAAATGVNVEAVFDSAAGYDYESPITQRLKIAEGMLHQTPDQRPVAESLGNGIVAHESVVTALLIACWFLDRPFEDLVGFCIAVGGDVDTIAAMSAGIWGAARGINQLPAKPLARLEDRELIEKLAQRLHEIVVG